MLFAFTDEQIAFRDAVRELLEKEASPQQVRAAAGGGPSRERWKKLADLGVLGIMAPPDVGGLGLSDVDMVLVLEETGRVVLPEPVVETAFVSVAALCEGTDLEGGARPPLLSEAVAGDAIITLSLGDPLVVHGEAADAMLASRHDEIHLVPCDRYTVEPQATLDPTRRVARVSWTPSEDTVVARDARNLMERAYDRVVLGTAAQALGVASRCVEMGAAYATQRSQFGRPIGSFQAVKHLLANAHIALEFARPAVYSAADSMARDASTRSRDVSMAKALASDAVTIACKAALQVHGAIGYTEEHDLHLWLRRGFALATAWGDAARHRARVGHAILG